MATKRKGGWLWFNIDQCIDNIFEVEDDEAEMGDIVVHVFDQSLVAMVRVNGDIGVVIGITFIHFKILFDPKKLKRRNRFIRLYL